MATDVYRPQTITDQPFIGPPDPRQSANSTSSVYYPAKVTTVPLPTGVIASTVINRNLNTQSRKILGSFTFGKLGAIQIGNYSSGSTGDIRITPSGIVGRNSSGTTTFSIDGTTGNATFLGTLAAGSVIASSVTVDWAQIQNVAIVNADINNVSASKITSGTLDANRIGADTITASKLSVSTLSAISGDMGTLTAGSITGGTITGVTITGGTVRTASSGTRVVIASTSAGTINFYDSSSYAGSLSAAGSGNFTLDTSGILKLTPGGSYYVHIDGNMWLAGHDIDMNDGLIGRLNRITWDTRSSNPSDSWALYMYENSGYSLRSRMNGSTWTVDQTSS